MNENRIEPEYLSIALRVKELPKKKSRDHEIWWTSGIFLRPEILEYYNLIRGDSIEISNPNSNKKIILPYVVENISGSNLNRGDIRLSSDERKLLDVSLNDIVYLNKPKDEIALAVDIAYFDGVKFLKHSKELARDFLYQKVQVGDILTLNKYNRTFELKITKIFPEVESACIFEHTKFYFEELSPDNPIVARRLKLITETSNKVSLNTLKNYLDLEIDSFIDLILEWEKTFDFKIEGNYIYFSKEDTSELIEKLEQKFNEWQKVEKTSCQQRYLTQYSSRIYKNKDSIISSKNLVDSKIDEKSISEENQSRREELLKILADLGDSGAISSLRGNPIFIPYRQLPSLPEEEKNILKKTLE